jgi:peptide/nickel transport system permease protein
MARFLLRRLVGLVAVLFAVSVILFLAFTVLPDQNPAQQLAGKNADAELIAAIEDEWGFDDPLPQQYFSMMEKVFTGELVSYQPRVDVAEQIAERVPATLSLSIGAAVIWLGFGLLLGYLGAVRAGSLLDRLLTVVAIAGVSIPVFLLAPVLLYFLSYQLEVFPAGEYVPLSQDPWEWMQHLILPWFTLAVVSIGFYSRVLRTNMLDVMEEDHVRTARAKGLGEGQVMRRHVLRNSLIPIVTLFGLDFGATIAGVAIITESLYEIDGVGYYATLAAANFELPPVIGVTLYGAFFVVAVNTAVDVFYAYLDPRVRIGGSAAR